MTTIFVMKMHCFDRRNSDKVFSTFHKENISTRATTVRNSSIKPSAKFIFLARTTKKKQRILSFENLFFNGLSWSVYEIMITPFFNMLRVSVFFHKRDGVDPNSCLAIPLFFTIS